MRRRRGRRTKRYLEHDLTLRFSSHFGLRLCDPSRQSALLVRGQHLKAGQLDRIFVGFGVDVRYRLPRHKNGGQPLYLIPRHTCYVPFLNQRSGQRGPSSKFEAVPPVLKPVSRPCSSGNGLLQTGAGLKPSGHWVTSRTPRL
jgi:hypothetical protein